MVEMTGSRHRGDRHRFVVPFPSHQSHAWPSYDHLPAATKRRAHTSAAVVFGKPGQGDACKIRADELCLSLMHCMVLWMRLLLLLISSPELSL
jgi:hypothetical protein